MVNAKVWDNFFKQMKERKTGREKKKSNLIVWRLHMVLWLFGSPWLAASRLRPFTVSTRWQTSLSSLHPPLNIPPPIIPTQNLVRGIIEEPNNKGVWGGVGKKKEGVSSDPQKTLSNKTGTLRGWQWSGLLFSVLRHWWGKIREFLNTAKKGRKGSTAFERFRPQIQTLPP